MGKREILIPGVKTFRGEGKAEQARDYVAGLLRDVKPSVLVMEKRTGGHGGRGIHGTPDHRERGAHGKRRPGKPVGNRAGNTFADKLYEFIARAAERSNVKLRLYPSRHIKRSLCGDERATWFQVEQVVTEQYGELKGCLWDKDSEREKYWRGMFEAVALGMV